MSLEFSTNDELVDELMKRPTFQGIIIYGKGEVNNTVTGDGGMKLRVSKGLQVKTLLTYMKGALETFRKMFPAAVEFMFPTPHSPEE